MRKNKNRIRVEREEPTDRHSICFKQIFGVKILEKNSGKRKTVESPFAVILIKCYISRALLYSVSKAQWQLHASLLHFVLFYN